MAKYSLLIIAGLLVIGGGITYLVAMPENGVSSTSSNTDQHAEGARWTRVQDLAGTYSMQLPSDWPVKREGGFEQQIDGLKRLSRLSAESVDWKIEGSNEINPSGHIVSGAAVEVYVFNQYFGNAPSEIGMQIKPVSSTDIVVDGTVGQLKTFREYNPPKYEEALVLDAVVIRDGIFYTFRIAYNPKTYSDGANTFRTILNSVIFLMQGHPLNKNSSVLHRSSFLETTVHG